MSEPVSQSFLVNEKMPETFMDINNNIGKALLFAGQNDLLIDRIYAGSNQHRIIREHTYPQRLEDVLKKHVGAQTEFRGLPIYTVTDQPDHWLTILIPRHEH